MWQTIFFTEKRKTHSGQCREHLANMSLAHCLFYELCATVLSLLAEKSFFWNIFFCLLCLQRWRNSIHEVSIITFIFTANVDKSYTISQRRWNNFVQCKILVLNYSQTFANNHLRIPTTCLYWPQFCGPIWNFLELLSHKWPLNNDHLSTKTTIFGSWGWSLYTGVWLYHIW